MFKTIICGVLLSGLTEATQLAFKLGLCELDDVLDNMIGAAVGAGILLMIEERWKEDMHKPYGSYEKYFKRLIDIICSLVAIIVFSWLYIILIILGAIFMRGNPFFTQERPGKNEKIFKLIKFRSMNSRRDKNGELLPDEVRLNKYGRLLRSTSLDELPEAFNILVGHMSIIGPRPLLVRYLPYYKSEERERHAVRPGLTGLAQVSGRNLLSWDERFEIDCKYVKHITFFDDVKILFATIKKVSSRSDITVDGNYVMKDLDEDRK